VHNIKSNESAENYLEAILILSGKLPVVRAVDVAAELEYKKSSVSIALKNLKEKEYVTVTDAGYIYLTPEGKEIAETIYERHQVITSLFESMGVEHEIAVEDACRIEHVISEESFAALKRHYNSCVLLQGGKCDKDNN